jgi:hypothetical protein
MERQEKRMVFWLLVLLGLVAVIIPKIVSSNRYELWDVGLGFVALVYGAVNLIRLRRRRSARARQQILLM